MKKGIKWTLAIVTILIAATAGIGAWIVYGKSVSNIMNHKTIGDI